MDFLDPKKQRAYKVRLIVGYCLVAIALILTTVILLYQAYGFGLDKNGKIIQSGLVFVSSTPAPAQVYVNGSRYKNDTNVRIPLPSGQYTVQLQRAGYTNWKRAITVEGGSVEHYDYPFLFPSKVQTAAFKTYDAKPTLVTQSPDRHWALVQDNPTFNHFEIYDLTQPKTATVKDITLPDSVTTDTQAGTADGWELAEWSTDNRHVVLKHDFTKDGQATYEYILVDRTDPTQSVNLTNAWGFNPTNIELQNNKYDSYYLYNKTAATLSTATLKQPTPVLYLDHVLAYKSYASNIMLYATNKNTAAGKVNIVWHQNGDSDYTLRTMAAGGTYLLNLTQYSGDWYVAVSDPSDGKVYVYKNPVDMLQSQHILVPVHILKDPGTTYLDFSDNARFIVAENGTQFAVYDAENDKGYVYDSKLPLDAPQVHATWMDGHRLTYTSKGKIVAFDFDSANPVTLNADSAAYLPMFSSDYKYLYTIGANADASKTVFDQTPLRTAQDL